MGRYFLHTLSTSIYGPKAGFVISPSFNHRSETLVSFMYLCPCQIIHIHSGLDSLPTDLASLVPSCLHYNLGFIFTASQCSSKSFFQGLQSQHAQPAFGSSLNPCSEILSPHQSCIFCVCKASTTQTMLPNYVTIRTLNLLGP